MYNAIIKLQELSIKVPDSSRTILEKIQYTINHRDFTVILGGNGSGKSSLMKIINQSYSPTSGNITYFGFDKKHPSHDIVTMTQNIEDSLFLHLNVLDNCILWVNKHSLPCSFFQKKKLTKHFASYLKTFNPNLANKMQTMVYKLSGGEKQALLLGLCFYVKPKLLLLDEHTSQLDPLTSQQAIESTARLVATYQIPCLMTTHQLDIALKYGNRLLALKNGQIVFQADGLAKEKLTKADLIEYCY